MSNKISIITATYNCAEKIEKTILSVINQSYPDVEYIIIDGGSIDGTIDVIKRYQSYITYWISEHDNGIYDAMNKGLHIASGRWVYFLNAGDVFYSHDCISKMSLSNYEDTSICGVFGKIRVNMNGVETEHCAIHPFYENTKLYKGMGFSHQAIFVKTEFAREVGFDLSFKLCADYNMMVQLYNSGKSFHFVDVIVSLIEGGCGASNDNRKLQMKEEARICGCENSLSFKLIYTKRLISMFIKSKVLNKR